jgi:nitrate/TMAO reductase-like tetraheme cytochrome c subunit
VAHAAPGSFPDFHHDPVESWASRILLWTLAAAFVLAVATLLRVWRGRVSGMAGRGLVVVSLVLLPMFCVATGMLLVFPRAERVEFCGSCHEAIGPYVEDMRNGAGLAAVHYRNQYIPANQCYACHTSYGLFGTVAAKVNGIRQVLRYYAGTYESPLEMWAPYRNRDCLKCHAESAKWRRHEEHVGDESKAALLGDRISCMDCHESGHSRGRLSLGAQR